jgi:hypothetical protein
VYRADKMVREAHGSASLVSRANISRDPDPLLRELRGLFTIAYNGYWNHNYNKWRGDIPTLLGVERWRSGGGGGPPPKGPRPGMGAPDPDADNDPDMTRGARIAMAAGFLTMMVAIPAYAHWKIHGKDQKDKDKKHWAEEEDEGMIPWSDMAEMGFSQVAGMVPGVNQLAYAASNKKRDPQILGGLEEIVHVFWDPIADLWAKKPTRQAQHLVKLGSFLVGSAIPNQLIDSASWLNSVRNGSVEPASAMEWAQGIMQVGPKQKPQKKGAPWR